MPARLLDGLPTIPYLGREAVSSLLWQDPPIPGDFISLALAQSDDAKWQVAVALPLLVLKLGIKTPSSPCLPACQTNASSLPFPPPSSPTPFAPSLLLTHHTSSSRSTSICETSPCIFNTPRLNNCIRYPPSRFRFLRCRINTRHHVGQPSHQREAEGPRHQSEAPALWHLHGYVLMMMTANGFAS